MLLLSTGIPAGDQVGRFRPFQPRSSLGLSFRGVEKESRDDYLEEASSDRTAMRFVALTDHLLDHVGNTRPLLSVSVTLPYGAVGVTGCLPACQARQ